MVARPPASRTAVPGRSAEAPRASGPGIPGMAPGRIHRACRHRPSLVRAGLLGLAVFGAALLKEGAAPAQEEAELVITQGRLYKIPIEVEDWAYVETPRRLFEKGETAEEVLRLNLVRSDFFDVRRQSFSIAPGGDSLQPPRPVKAVAGGEVRKRGTKVELSGRLTDATTGKLIFNRTYPLGDPPDRWAVHSFSDDIVLYLTGERGTATTRIAYVGDATGKKEIYVVDADGARAEMVTTLGSITVSPRWSPDGERLAFTTFARGRPELVGLRLKESRTWTISSREGMNSAPCWHPDGQHLAASLSFEGNSEIYILDAQGREARRLTHSMAIDTSPTFSPDGSRLAFTSDRSGEPQVYVMGADGTGLSRLTYVGKHCDSPDWSPKGDRIVFVSLIDPSVFDICTVRPDGTDLWRLTAGNANHENPRWAPDGRHIVFAKRERGRRNLWVMAADGSGIRQLTYARGDQYNPAWSPPLSVSGP